MASGVGSHIDVLARLAQSRPVELVAVLREILRAGRGGKEEDDERRDRKSEIGAHRSRQVATAIDMDCLSGDVAGVGTAQHPDHRCHLVRLSQAPIGGTAGRCSCCPGSPEPAARTVSMRPGTTQLTVIRCGARSSASAFVMPASPAFAVTTCARPAVAPVAGLPADIDDRSSPASHQMRNAGAPSREMRRRESRPARCAIRRTPSR